jgi:hypothetical protein
MGGLSSEVFDLRAPAEVVLHAPHQPNGGVKGIVAISALSS